MRSWIISLLLLFAMKIMATGDTLNVEVDSTASLREIELQRKIERYEQRIEKYNNFFNSLVPDFLRLQYAGSIGLINVGCGWEHGKKEKFETDIMFGFVPKYEKEAAFLTFTARETYVPWTKPLYKDKFSFQPLACGIFVNSVLNSDYWTREPDRYPNGSYYRFSSKLRIHLFVGQRYTMNIPREKRYMARNVSAVWELSTCDLYIISKAMNSTLSWHDILSLSLGLKYCF